MADEEQLGVVRVLHFARPSLSISRKHLKMLNEAAADYQPQGVLPSRLFAIIHRIGMKPVSLPLR